MHGRSQRSAVHAVVVAGLCVSLSAATTAIAAPKKPVAKPAAAGGLVSMVAQPSAVHLSGAGTTQQLLVFARYANGTVKDVTAHSTFGITKEGVVSVDKRGVVSAVGDGDSQVTVRFGGKTFAVKAAAEDTNTEHVWSFANEVVPVFTKTGCNTGGCHGSPSGRGGFKLSLFGYEPEYDHDMILKDSEGKRIDLKNPEKSLLIAKPTLGVPHGGGPRFKKGSNFYNRLVTWMKAGAPLKQAEFDARLKGIEVYPRDWVLPTLNQSQRIIVVARRDDGTTQDVTEYARFTTNDDQVVEVDDDGIMTAVGKGETSLMIRYLGGVDIVRVKVPRDPVPATEFTRFTPVNYVDQAVLRKLKDSRIAPSGAATDEEFLRRAYLDGIGRIPTVDEARQFLDDEDPQKRTKLVDQLLNSPDWVSLWTLKWSDLLRNNPQAVQDKGMYAQYRWLRESLTENKPYDQFVREIITANGSSFRNGPANWYVTAGNPEERASTVSQVFLGVRIDCARCHNHPFESWSQNDYYHLAAFFARVRTKNGPDPNERIIYHAADGEVNHPRTREAMTPKYLSGDVLERDKLTPDQDRREFLARWLTSPSNPFFSRSIVNRVWNHFFGRGIVHPVDDFRLTNPAMNPQLMDVLAGQLVAKRWNLKAVMRDIMLSRTYQASAIPNKLNVDDRQLFSHALPRRLPAEYLLDAIVSATSVPEQFGPYPLGTRAVEVPSNRVPNWFLDLFGRPRREVACECERPEDANVSMVLNLLNGGTLNNRIGHPNGRVVQLVKANKPDREIIETIYLASLSRRPSAKEVQLATKLITTAPNRQEGVEDLMWSVLNMKEFLFNH